FSTCVFAQNNNYYQNRAPLHPNPYINLPLGAIKPSGWLNVQLQKMKTGMTGQLDKLYPIVLGSRNGWLGGDGDVWERGPYWIDGLVPLAYILNDEALKNKIKPWIEWSINNQMADGYFGPTPPAKEPEDEPGIQRGLARDWWPKMVMLKALQQYYMATEDKRVIDLMTKYFKYQLNTLPTTPLGHYSWWGSQRGADNLLVVYWLYNITGDKFLLDLAKIIHQQTYNWTDNFLYSGDLYTTYKFHGVNLAQGIKAPVIYYQQDNDEKYVRAVQKAFHDIRNYQGQVQGMYGADEFMRGNDPVQGSEFCTATELMYSLENMIAITGNVNMMDHLERIAFNALPTQADDEFMSRQYYQQANQVYISRGERNFMISHDGTDNCFGVLTGYPCCTTNMHQGWPKFVQNLWMATEDNGIAALVYAPSEVNTKLPDGTAINFTEETDYPFNDVVKLTYKSAASVVFPLHLRVPSWCEQATVKINGEVLYNQKGGQIIKIGRKWKKGDVVELKMPMKISTSRWFNNSVGIERGPLVYALKVEEKWKNVKNEKDPEWYGDYKEVYPASDWNYAIWNKSLEDLSNNFVISEKKVGNEPWNLQNAPITIKTKGKKVPGWQMYNGDAGPLPYSPLAYAMKEKVEEITLIPYGCTTLRISQFPVAY
ncbi:MAG: glycoside hydrolase family 127 protein, partial [Chitinophagaceae bacterium]|nr:glycoside hydrolase family 127 protein [Chitinophagaceae bacterium]